MDQYRQLNALFKTQLDNRRNRSLSLATWLSVGLAAGLSLLMVLAGIVLIRRSAQRERRHHARQHELRDLLQVSVSEEESQLLLIHHVQRAIPGAAAAVQTATTVMTGSNAVLIRRRSPAPGRADHRSAQASLVHGRAAQPALPPEARRGTAAAV